MERAGGLRISGQKGATAAHVPAAPLSLSARSTFRGQPLVHTQTLRRSNLVGGGGRVGFQPKQLKVNGRGDSDILGYGRDGALAKATSPRDPQSMCGASEAPALPLTIASLMLDSADFPRQPSSSHTKRQGAISAGKSQSRLSEVLASRRPKAAGSDQATVDGKSERQAAPARGGAAAYLPRKQRRQLQRTLARWAKSAASKPKPKRSGRRRQPAAQLPAHECEPVELQSHESRGNSLVPVLYPKSAIDRSAILGCGAPGRRQVNFRQAETAAIAGLLLGLPLLQSRLRNSGNARQRLLALNVRCQATDGGGSGDSTGPAQGGGLNGEVTAQMGGMAAAGVLSSNSSNDVVTEIESQAKRLIDGVTSAANGPISEMLANGEMDHAVLRAVHGSAAAERDSTLSRSGNRTTGRRWWRKLLTAVAAGIGLALFPVLRSFLGSGGPRPYPTAGSTMETAAAMTRGGSAMYTPSFNEKASYALDLFFSSHPLSKVALLLSVVLLMTMLGGLAYYLVTPEEDRNTLSEEIWNSWTMVADQGTHVTETGPRRWVALPLTIGGMLFFATLVGLISDGLSSKVEEFSLGGRVIETGHTIVVGWTPQTPVLVDQLAMANESTGQKRAVVVLAEADKQAMDSTLKELAAHAGKTRIVTRSGSGLSPEDLKRCNAPYARSVIVLSEGSGPSQDESDARVVQTCMMLDQMVRPQGRIIAEFTDEGNVDIFKRAVPDIEMLNGRIFPVAANHMAGRMTVYKACNPGYASVVKELLGFEGEEFYLKEWPILVGKSFSEACFMFDRAVVCGIKQPGKPAVLNPPPDTTVAPGDKILVLAQDANAYAPGHLWSPAPILPPRPLGYLPPPDATTTVREASEVLICGWRTDIEDILFALQETLPANSQISIFSNVPIAEREARLEHVRTFSSLVFRNFQGSTVSRRDLESLPLEHYDKVIILGDAEGEAIASLASGDGEHITDMSKEAREDSRSLATAMYIRHIQAQRGRNDSWIVAEMNGGAGTAAHDAFRSAWLDDYTVPDDVQGMVLANMNEDVEVGRVLSAVVSDRSQEMVAIRPSTDFVEDGELASFWDLQYQALAHNEIIIGWKRGDGMMDAQGHDKDTESFSRLLAPKSKETNLKWTLNPSRKRDRLHWSHRDQLVVITKRPSADTSFSFSFAWGGVKDHNTRSLIGEQLGRLSIGDHTSTDWEVDLSPQSFSLRRRLLFDF